MTDKLKAFPQTDRVGYVSKTEGGMDLRDYFAAQVVNGFLAGRKDGFRGSQAGISNYAKFAYELADAMLKVRGAK